MRLALDIQAGTPLRHEQLQRRSWNLGCLRRDHDVIGRGHENQTAGECSSLEISSGSRARVPRCTFDATTIPHFRMNELISLGLAPTSSKSSLSRSLTWMLAFCCAPRPLHCYMSSWTFRLVSRGHQTIGILPKSSASPHRTPLSSSDTSADRTMSIRVRLHDDYGCHTRSMPSRGGNSLHLGSVVEQGSGTFKCIFQFRHQKTIEAEYDIIAERLHGQQPRIQDGRWTGKLVVARREKGNGGRYVNLRPDEEVVADRIAAS